MLSRTLLVLATILMGRLAASTAPPERPVPGEARLEVVRLLHDGRFDEADERLSVVGRFPAGPDRDFLRAFVLYWRLLYDPDNPALKIAFGSRLDAAVASAAARLAEAPADAEALLGSGTAHLFLAELRASEKRSFAAAMEARRARAELEEAAVANPDLADPSFGLGTVDVLADALPSVARGLSSVLGLGGNRERGLRRLERAAAGGRTFALEARLFLLSIHSSRRRREYDGALGAADLVAAFVPRSVASLDGAARVRLSLGAAGQAATDLDGALAAAAEAPRTDRSVLATLLVERSRAEIALFRPDRALDGLRRLVPLRAAIPPDLLKKAAEVVRVAASSGDLPGLAELEEVFGTGSAPPALAGAGDSWASWKKGIPALDLERGGEQDQAADLLEALARDAPGDAVLALLAGRAAVLAGRAARARLELARAESSRLLPPAWLGPCLLFLGRAADLGGDRQAAMGFYRRAAAAPSFVEREAAWLHLRVPYRAPS